MKEARLSDAEIARLEQLLAGAPAPLQPLDTSALDGFLCGVLLQPRRPAPGQWLKYATDIDGRAATTVPGLAELHALVRRRHVELDAAIADRQWFDPWVYALDAHAPPSQSVVPWVAGFAAAMDVFPALMSRDDEALIEPLAILYAHFDSDDLEDADELLAVIDTLEPAADLVEAVQDVVRAVMLIADVTRPRAA